MVRSESSNSVSGLAAAGAAGGQDVATPPQGQEGPSSDGQDDSDPGERGRTHGDATAADDQTTVGCLHGDIEGRVTRGTGAHVDRDARRLFGECQWDVSVLVTRELQLLAL